MGSPAGRTSDGADGDGAAVYGAVLIADKMALVRAVTAVFRARCTAGGAGGGFRKAGILHKGINIIVTQMFDFFKSLANIQI